MRTLTNTTVRDTAYFAIILFVALGLGWIVFSKRYFPRMEKANYAVLVIAFYLSILFVSFLTHS